MNQSSFTPLRFTSESRSESGPICPSSAGGFEPALHGGIRRPHEQVAPPAALAELGRGARARGPRPPRRSSSTVAGDVVELVAALGRCTSVSAPSAQVALVLVVRGCSCRTSSAAALAGGGRARARWPRMIASSMMGIDRRRRRRPAGGRAPPRAREAVAAVTGKRCESPRCRRSWFGSSHPQRAAEVGVEGHRAARPSGYLLERLHRAEVHAPVLDVEHAGREEHPLPVLHLRVVGREEQVVVAGPRRSRPGPTLVWPRSDRARRATSTPRLVDLAPSRRERSRRAPGPGPRSRSSKVGVALRWTVAATSRSVATRSGPAPSPPSTSTWSSRAEVGRGLRGRSAAASAWCEAADSWRPATGSTRTGASNGLSRRSPIASKRSAEAASSSTPSPSRSDSGVERPAGTARSSSRAAAASDRTLQRGPRRPTPPRRSEEQGERGGRDAAPRPATRAGSAGGQALRRVRRLETATAPEPAAMAAAPTATRPATSEPVSGSATALVDGGAPTSVCGAPGSVGHRRWATTPPECWSCRAGGADAEGEDGAEGAGGGEAPHRW